MQKHATVTLVVAGLLISIGIIYMVCAYEEPIQAAEERAADAGAGNGGSSGGVNPGEQGGMDLGTLVQTTFFAIAGVANLGVAAWILVAARKKPMLVPYIITAVGSAILITIYIASRTVDMPIVGIQNDVASIDILCKALQAAVIGISVYGISLSHRMTSGIRKEVA